MTIYGNTQKVIFDYAIIEAGCSDNPGVRIKGVWTSDGLLYIICKTLACAHSMVMYRDIR